MRLAHESAVERGILLEHTAPHLVRALPSVLPLGRDTSGASAATLWAGLTMGDLLRTAAGTPRATLPRPRRVGAEEAARLAPGLDPSGLRGALLTWDGQVVDDARLVLAVARTAAGFGARILTRCAALRVHAAARWSATNSPARNWRCGPASW